jgi:Flp pilus assembly protein TadD
MSQNKPGEAATWFRKFAESSRGNPEDALVGAWCLSAALESGKSFTEAAAAYADAAKRSSSDNERGRAMLGEARCYMRAGQNEKAIETYRAVLKLQLADQPIYDAANARLGELRADVAK